VNELHRIGYCANVPRRAANDSFVSYTVTLDLLAWLKDNSTNPSTWLRCDFSICSAWWHFVMAAFRLIRTLLLILPLFRGCNRRRKYFWIHSEWCRPTSRQ